MKRMFILCACFFILTYCSYAQIKINEVVASNALSLIDEDDESPDWIELYNTSDKNINLKDYRIYDKDDYQKAWVFPDTVIKAKSYLTLFASNKDRQSSDKYIIEAAGTSITAGKYEDEAFLINKRLTDDFEVEMHVHSIRKYGKYGKAGFVVRESLEQKSRSRGFFMLNNSRPKYELLLRNSITSGSEAKRYHAGDELNFPNGKVKLAKVGNKVTFSIWVNNYRWHNIFAYDIDMPNGFYLCFAFSSGTKDKKGLFAVSDFKYNGKPLNFDDFSKTELGSNIKSNIYKSKELHTNFKLSRSNDKLTLWNANGDWQDDFEYNNHTPDVSFARDPDNFQIKQSFPSTPSEINANFITGICNVPDLTIPGGWFSNPQQVSIIKPHPLCDVYYTLDGSQPDKNSTLYKNNVLTLNSTTVLKTRVYRENYYPSRVTSRTFFINETSTLPVISIALANNDLYDNEDGLFVEKNIKKSIEKEASFEIWNKEKKYEYSCNAEVKLHGQRSKTFAQKSLRFIAKNRYDSSMFNHNFFADQGRKKYKKILFRNGGTSWSSSIFVDGFVHMLAKDMKHLLPTSFRPAISFLNGKYYGISNMREKYGPELIAERFKIDERSVNMMEDNSSHMAGSSVKYFNLYNKIIDLDMSKAESIDFVNTNICLDNFIDFITMEIYIANIDWPWKNMKWWQSDEYDSKWRWIMNDLDYSFGCSASSPDYDMFPLCTDTKYAFPKLLMKLWENKSIKERYINRTCDVLNSYFLPHNTSKTLDSFKLIFKPEIPRLHAKYSEAAVDWDDRIKRMERFAQKRATPLREHIKKHFALKGTVDMLLEISSKDAGYIEVNSITANSFPWKGVYFAGVKIRLKAKAKHGYSFQRWSESSLGNNPEILIDPEQHKYLTAIFEKNNDAKDLVVINEIMYKPSKKHDTKDWIELYNAGLEDVNISGWVLKDSDDDHSFTIPHNTILKAGDSNKSFMVICKDQDALLKLHPKVLISTGDIDFGFGGDDHVRLFNNNNEIVDEVAYTDSQPWPTGANGTGASIELKNPILDNVLPLNWYVSKDLYGTPGKPNSSLSVTDSPKLHAKLCPNPCSEKTMLSYYMEHNAQVSISIINTLGETITSLEINKFQIVGDYRHTIPTQMFSNGLYYCRIVENNRSQLLPFIVLK